MTIGSKIENLRKKKKMSQEKLADLLGITRQTLSNYENDITSPDLNQAKKICEVFDASLDELTDNKTDYIILKKVTKNESNIKKIIRITGITLGVSIFFILLTAYILIQIFKYFEATPTSKSVRFECTINDQTNYYEIVLDNHDKVISLNTNDSELANLDISTFQNQYELTNHIHEYVTNKKGICN